MAFQVINRATIRGGSVSTSPTVCIGKAGVLGFNKAAQEQYVGENKGAILAFDDKTQRIGIQFLDERDPSYYTVSKSISGRTTHSCQLYCAHFFRSIGINPEVVAGTYDIQETQKYLVISLRKNIQTMAR